ncbi:inorganic triphosphatase YgiF [Variovorax boronicumulans]|uniref:Inorganic triphosphatase YgiF n=1 Tax=Variovorax boronicumulans TaxID=436515 RepID=A0AAW8CZA2_9BURK|nr:CYTH and CHAD domain-containing protein [Variovorax boronicumulans]MDP9893549.1 inorganic triphosphatase YgiF [Variovorax boronicumulans]MDQ0053337.1 inorganic triphosphatase YgiF [Variovorax boronicumulans]
MAAMEIEFKFQIPPDRLKAVETALRRGTVVRTRLQARYFDTADQALAAEGIVLRLRKEGRRWVQTVKATGDNALHRLEHNVDLGTAATGGASPAIDPQRHQGTPVGERLAKVLAASGAPLVERQSTDIVRLTRDVRVTGPGGAVVEMALDVGKVVAYAGTPEQCESPVCELELELKRGDVQGLVSLARRWSQQHGLWFSTVSKAERGARLLAKVEVVPAVKAETPRFPEGKDKLDGRAIQQAIVASCLAQMLPNASEIAAGSTDEEQIHQLRIGIRRLRTALREVAGLDAGSALFDAAGWEPPLVEAFRALGDLRDREQVVKLAQPQLREAGAPEFDPLAGGGDDAATDVRSPGDVVRAPAFQSVLVSLIGFTAAAPPEEAAPKTEDAATPPTPTPMSLNDARRLLRKRLQHLHKQAVRDGKRFESLDTESQHRVRKRLKRLRYLAEFVAPLFDAEGKSTSSSAAERYLKHLRPAQDALGEFNDEAVALALYREATARDGRAWLAVGWFSARHAVHAKACRKALSEIEEAPRFWKKAAPAR